MNARQQVLTTIALALLVFSFHLRLKKDPDYNLIKQLSEESFRPGEWIGKLPPDLEATTIDGQKFKLSEHVGREVIVLNFFATWCAPCRAEMPELQRFYEKHANQPVMLVGVDAYEPSNIVTRYRSNLKLKFPIVIASQVQINSYGVNSFPTTIVIGPDGRIQLYEISAIANADVTLEPFVQSGLGIIAAGKGITEPQFRAASAREARPTSVRDSSDEGPRLTGRALQIASTTDCVCGCTDKLTVCKCATATKMKQELQKGDFGTKSDAEIKTALNAKFCMKSGM